MCPRYSKGAINGKNPYIHVDYEELYYFIRSNSFIQKSYNYAVIIDLRRDDDGNEM